MLRCLIIDDEEMATKVIKNHVQQIDSLEVVGVCFNAMDAFSILQREKIDLLFLDIQMPKMTGLSLLKSLSRKPHVILTTAHRDFALDGFELDVVDYLLKPIAFDRFLKSIGKVFRLEKSVVPILSTQNQNSTLTPSFFYIKSDRQNIKILLEDVQFIESLRNHVRIITSKGNYTTLIGISQIEEKLPPQHFVRVHRSFIVALSKINQFSQTHLTVGEKVLPIGNIYKENVLGKLNINLM